MTWIVQSTNLRAENGDRLMNALRQYNIEFYDVGVIPFTTQISGLDQIELDSSKPVFFYGSTKLVRLASELGLTPGVFFDPSTFNTFAWDRFLGPWMLNMHQPVLVRDLINAKNHDGDWFVRPVMDLKMFSGTIKKAEDNWWEFFEQVFNGNHKIKVDALVNLSTPKKILGEWRMFIVDGKPVTGSQYRDNGNLVRYGDDVIPGEVWSAAHSVCKHWLPNKNCVMDLAIVDDCAHPRVIEFNCINASGLYGADVEKLVHHIESMLEKHYG